MHATEGSKKKWKSDTPEFLSMCGDCGCLHFGGGRSVCTLWKTLEKGKVTEAMWAPCKLGVTLLTKP